MNLYEAIESHHQQAARLDLDSANEIIRTSCDPQIRLGLGQTLTISMPQVAALVTYSGPINQCLTQTEYEQFSDLVTRASERLRTAFKQHATHATIVKTIATSRPQEDDVF